MNRNRVFLSILAWSCFLLVPAGAFQKAEPPADPTVTELLKKAYLARGTIDANSKKIAAFDKFLQGRIEATQTALLKAADSSIFSLKALGDLEAARKKLAVLINGNKSEIDQAKQEMVVKELAKQKAFIEATKAKEKFEILARASEETEKLFSQQKENLVAQVNEAAAIEALALGGLKPLDARQWDRSKARHLLNRAGFGGTPQEVDALTQMGLHLAVDFLLEFQRQPGSQIPFESQLPEAAQPGEMFLTPMEIQNREFRRRAADGAQLNNLKSWWLQRMVQGQRPLQEKLVLFWHGHFTSEHRVVQNAHAMYRQNELFRENAAGNFSHLLHGIVHDPAMLRYLDNNSNVKSKPNENLARELMELFAMGEGNGYKEKDIMEGARALTGFVYDPLSCQFRFDSVNHDFGAKVIFGTTANFSGDEFVDLILRQPATSRHAANRLYAFFARQETNRASVERLASVLRRAQFEIKPLLRNLFLSEEFYHPQTMASQVKSPGELVVGFYRELGQKEVNYPGLDLAMRAMGQELFNPPNVKGWEGGKSWINANSLVTRFNQTSSLIDRPLVFAPPVAQRPALTQVDVAALLAPFVFNSPVEVVNHMVRRHLAVPLNENKKAELVKYLGNFPPSREWEKQKPMVNSKLRGLLSLLLASPEYQLH
ncbi:MAG: DUF1800 domain-containing protein [Gemmataceae bacterium]|nr:DUF1800 domain-containing protein [Gemmataceae bacterium]